MLVKMGVDVSSAKDPIRRARKKVDDVFKKHGEPEAVLTSTNGGNHRTDSFHYVNLADDYRGPMVHPEKFDDIVKDIRAALGSDYDVIAHKNVGRFGYLHVEYDPK